MTNLSMQKSEVSEQELTQIFKETDLDGDGYISMKEAKRAYKKLSIILKRPSDPVRQILLASLSPIVRIASVEAEKKF